jgi:HSP20 family molecular chaperone IbpA
MSQHKEDIKKESQKQEKRTNSYKSVVPHVDIFEDNNGITLIADLPGVSSEGLDLQIDNEILSIDGAVELPRPQGAEEGYAGRYATCYQRSFSLSKEVDGNQAEATLKDGVLALHIPKRQEYQPRKIEIRSG